MDTLKYVLDKYDLNIDRKSPVEIPNVGRDDLAALFAELGFVRGVEVGVERGFYSEVLCRANPGLMLWCVDPWETYTGYRDYVTAEKVYSFYEDAKQRLKPYGCRLVRKFSMDAVKEFENRSLDFVYIDGNHQFEFVAQDIGFWARKVRRGGIISGHDFIRRKAPTATHVVEAVQGYTYAYDIRPWFLLGRQAKVEGEKRDDSRSWFWVQS